MIEPEDRYDTICSKEFAVIRKQLGRLDVAIRGNGRLGINTCLDRVERAMRWLWVVIGAVGLRALEWLYLKVF